MIQVTKKDKSESTESLVRRFTRKVQQSGLLIEVKQRQRFEKPLSKRDRRSKAITRRARRDVKQKRMKMGLK
jgi:ribosomal protein S21